MSYDKQSSESSLEVFDNLQLFSEIFNNIQELFTNIGVAFQQLLI